MALYRSAREYSFLPRLPEPTRLGTIPVAAYHDRNSSTDRPQYSAASGSRNQSFPSRSIFSAALTSPFPRGE